MLQYSKSCLLQFTNITQSNMPLGAGTAVAGQTVVGIQMRDEGSTLDGGVIAPKEILDGMFLDLHSNKGRIGIIPFRLIINMSKIHGYYPLPPVVLDLSLCQVRSNVATDMFIEIIFLLK